MDESTPLEINFGCRNGSMGWGSSPPPEGTNPRIRTVSFTPYPHSQLAYVSGRVSVGKNWPLGFEIEPFDYKKVKVGHRLKVKAFPVALPKT